MDKYIGFGIFVFCVVLSVVLSPFIGVSWDEPDNIWAAGVYIKFFQSGMDPSILIDKNSSASYFHEKIFTQEPSLYRYPPVPLFVGAGITLAWERVAGRPLSPLEIITAFHIASGVFWALLAGTAYGFARLCVSSRIVALLVSFLVVFHPLLFGHGVSVIKDSAQASLFALSLFFLVKSTQMNNIVFLLIGAFVWGSAMATKMNAVYVPIVWGSWRIIQWLLLLRQVKKFQNRIIKEFLCIVRDCGIVIIGGVVVMILLWPYLWYDPFSRLQEVIRYFTYVGTGYKVCLLYTS
ncbi:MAG: hypothetical protein N3A54_07100, partial [Patescibacteria group bacterium]|nr:hypothetical protein [Patescibacteria group bacterium]